MLLKIIKEDPVLSYEYLEHTADIIINAKGKDLKEAFEQAALGFYDMITDLTIIDTKIDLEIEFESEDYESLLYDWIEWLIYYFDTKHFISNKIQVITLEKINESKITFKATLKGEEFNLEKHPQETEVKAMTYSFMKIGDNFVEFTLDL